MSKWYAGWLCAMLLGLVMLVYQVGRLNGIVEMASANHTETPVSASVQISDRCQPWNIVVDASGHPGCVVEPGQVVSSGTDPFAFPPYDLNWDCWAIFTQKNNPKAFYSVYFRSIRDQGGYTCTLIAAQDRLRATTKPSEYAEAVIERIGIHR